MDRLKIIIVHSGDLDINTGGGVHTLELLKNLSKKHDVTCLVSNSNISDLYPQIKTIPRLKMRGLKSLSYDFFVGLFILHQFIKNKPDIIYARKPGYGLFPAILSKIIRATYIIELNGLKRNDAQALDPQINNYYLAAMDIVEKINYVLAYNIIAVTRELKLALINKYGISKSKIVIIENGVNTEVFKPIDRDVAIEKTHLDPSRQYVCFVGGLAPWHGVHFLIQAAPAVIKKIPNVMFLIIGNGPTKESLLEQTQKLGLSKYFLFTGQLAHNIIPSLINSSNACVAPFTAERNSSTGLSPLKIYEYLACGKPVVTSNLSGMRELIETIDAGILIEPGNISELENAIISMLDESYQSRFRSNQIAEYMKENHSWEAVSDKTERLLLIAIRKERLY